MLHVHDDHISCFRKEKLWKVEPPGYDKDGEEEGVDPEEL